MDIVAQLFEPIFTHMLSGGLSAAENVSLSKVFAIQLGIRQELFSELDSPLISMQIAWRPL